MHYTWWPFFSRYSVQTSILDMGVQNISNTYFLSIRSIAERYCSFKFWGFPWYKGDNGFLLISLEVALSITWLGRYKFQLAISRHQQYKYINVHIYTCTPPHTHMYVYMYVCICALIFLCVCMLELKCVGSNFLNFQISANIHTKWSRLFACDLLKYLQVTFGSKAIILSKRTASHSLCSRLGYLHATYWSIFFYTLSGDIFLGTNFLYFKWCFIVKCWTKPVCVNSQASICPPVSDITYFRACRSHVLH